MGKIKLVLVDDHQIVCEGIEAMLNQVEDIEFVDTFSSLEMIRPKLTLLARHIILVNMYQPDNILLDHIKNICKNFTRIKVLVLCFTDDEKFILNTIKSGAKGYLGKGTQRKDLIEALYTIYNGHDFYDKSITNLILKSYVELDKKKHQPGLELLSDREKEVIRLFGESYTNKEIAEKLFISVRTVESHKTNIMKKINLKTTVDLVKFAIKNNIIEI
ncbi:MAG: response regulator transcription factor [Bacteroidales bacterium]|nr:response regulator transcription factor [Bacteroidales bacterium]